MCPVSTMSGKSTELIPSSINIIKIHIYSWLWALFSFPPSLRRCVMSACSLVLPFKISLISTETFLWAPYRPMLFSVYFSRKTFWQKTKASCHLWVYISVLFYLTTNLILIYIHFLDWVEDIYTHKWPSVSWHPHLADSFFLPLYYRPIFS